MKDTADKTHMLATEDMTIVAIRQEFSRLFPYLKLDFFPAGRARGSRVGVAANTMLGEYLINHKGGGILISPTMTVAQLADSFRENYGLAIHLSRSSGKIWLETTLTENWTLEEQNRQGELLSKKK